MNFAHRNHGGRLTNAQAHKRQRVAHLAAGGAVVGGVALAELAVDIVPKATRESMDPKDEITHPQHLTPPVRRAHVCASPTAIMEAV